MKRRQATDHDRKIVARLIEKIPEDSGTIVWLKEAYIPKYALVKDLNIIDGAVDLMKRNVVGLDDRQANDAYRKLKDTMEAFHLMVSINLFIDDDYKMMKMSSEWSRQDLKRLTEDLSHARNSLVVAYDDFLRVCHRKGLY